VGTGNNYSVPDGVCTTPQQTGCTSPVADDYVDSILALKLRDGTVAWADHTLNSDLWTLPQPVGPDFDFGAGLTCSLLPARSPAVRSNCSASARKRCLLGARPATGKVICRHNRSGGRRNQRRHRVRHGYRRTSHLRGRG